MKLNEYFFLFLFLRILSRDGGERKMEMVFFYLRDLSSLRMLRHSKIE